MFISGNNVNFSSKVSFGVSNETYSTEHNSVVHYRPRNAEYKHPTSENYRAYLNAGKVEKNNEEFVNNIVVAKDALNYVKNMKLKSNTKMEHDNPIMIYQPTEEYQDTISNIAYLNKIRKNKNIDEYVKMTKERAPLIGVGNCSDQAILAASYLIDKIGMDNVALIACTMKGQNPKNPNATDQHVFAVLGLDETAELTHPETWGKNAVVLDPWGGFVAPVDTDSSQINAMDRLYTVFRTKYMTFDGYAKYIDPSKDMNSKYNWENYRRNLHGSDPSIKSA